MNKNSACFLVFLCLFALLTYSSCITLKSNLKKETTMVQTNIKTKLNNFDLLLSQFNMMIESNDEVIAQSKFLLEEVQTNCKIGNLHFDELINFFSSQVNNADALKNETSTKFDRYRNDYQSLNQEIVNLEERFNNLTEEQANYISTNAELMDTFDKSKKDLETMKSSLIVMYTNILINSNQTEEELKQDQTYQNYEESLNDLKNNFQAIHNFIVEKLVDQETGLKLKNLETAFEVRNQFELDTNKYLRKVCEQYIEILEALPKRAQAVIVDIYQTRLNNLKTLKDEREEFLRLLEDNVRIDISDLEDSIKTDTEFFIYNIEWVKDTISKYKDYCSSFEVDTNDYVEILYNI